MLIDNRVHSAIYLIGGLLLLAVSGYFYISSDIFQHIVSFEGIVLGGGLLMSSMVILNRQMEDNANTAGEVYFDSVRRQLPFLLLFSLLLLIPWVFPAVNSLTESTPPFATLGFMSIMTGGAIVDFALMGMKTLEKIILFSIGELSSLVLALLADSFEKWKAQDLLLYFIYFVVLPSGALISVYVLKKVNGLL